MMSAMGETDQVLSDWVGQPTLHELRRSFREPVVGDTLTATATVTAQRHDAGVALPTLR